MKTKLQLIQLEKVVEKVKVNSNISPRKSLSKSGDRDSSNARALPSIECENLQKSPENKNNDTQRGEQPPPEGQLPKTAKIEKEDNSAEMATGGSTTDASDLIDECCECSKDFCDVTQCNFTKCCYVIGHTGSNKESSSAESVRSCASRPPPKKPLTTIPAEWMKSSKFAKLPHHDPTTWMTDYKRVEAEKYLKNEPDGTFLIRPSSYTNKFALSVVSHKIIHHFLIRYENKAFGFTSSLMFPDLKSLVLYFSIHSLRECKKMLDVYLTKPLNRKRESFFQKIFRRHSKYTKLY